MVKKPQEMANLQTNFYEEKMRKLMEKIPVSGRNPLRYLDRVMGSWEGKGSFPTFNFREISLLETGKLLDNLADSKSFGHNGLDALALKNAGGHLIRPLQHLINMSLMKGKFAMKWKISK